MGYAEFELNIPEIMRRELPIYFGTLSASALTLENISQIPANAQGAYMLFLNHELVYIGKTDAQAGFKNRLVRHRFNVDHRKNLNPDDVTFKAVRIFVFSNFDLEAMLIEEFTKISGRPGWNFSGFGSNDPGRNRETQEAAKFDLDYPVDIDREIDCVTAGTHDLLQVVKDLKDGLPYVFRYDTDGRHYSRGHPNMESRSVTISGAVITTRSVLRAILSALSQDWQATVLPNRIILYKENKTYEQQTEVLRSSP